MPASGSTSTSGASFVGAAAASPSASAKVKAKACKWCGRSPEECKSWARAGEGLECNSCRAYILWNYRGAAKEDLANELAAEPHSGGARRQAFYEEVQQYERECDAGVRHPRMVAKVSKQSTTKLCGSLKLGIFWPKDIYEAHHGKLAAADAQTYEHAGRRLVALPETVHLCDV